MSIPTGEESGSKPRTVVTVRGCEVEPKESEEGCRVFEVIREDNQKDVYRIIIEAKKEGIR